MTNRFFNETYTGTIGQSVSAQALDTQFAGITVGNDLIQAEIDALSAIRAITGLIGFPASFAGQAGKSMVVNTAESALEFVIGGGLIIKPIGGTSYTLLATDAGKLLITTSASAVMVTVPPDVLSQGNVVCIRQGSTGQVTLLPGSVAVTFASSDNLLSTRTQSAQIALIADGGNAFGVIGERNAPSLGVALLAQANVFTKAQTVTPVALTDAATIATDASLSNNFTVTLGGNRTLNNPTNMANGVILNFKIKQDATGTRTLAYGSKFKWAGGTAPVLSTAASARDFITAQYFSDEDILVSAIMKGIA